MLTIINWVPGCQTTGESHSVDMERLWRGGYYFIRSRPLSGFGNYSSPTCFSCLSEQGVWGLEGRIGLPALQPVPCLSGSCMGALYISILGLSGIVLLGAVYLPHHPAAH